MRCPHQQPARFVSAAAIVCLAAAGAPSQGATLSLRQATQRPWTLFENLPERQWIPGTGDFSSMDPQRGDRVLIESVGAGKPRLAFTAAQLHAALLKASAQAPASHERITTAFGWLDAQTIRLHLPDGIYRWNIQEEAATKTLALPKKTGPLAVSPRDRRVAFIKERQLHVQSEGGVQQLTVDGSADVVYGGPAHRSEFGIHDGLWWSPDDRFLAFFREDLSPVTAYPYADHTKMPPAALHGRYPMAGRANSYVQVGVYDTQTRRLHYLKFGDQKDIYWTNITFAPDGREVYAAIVNRGQDHMQLVRFSSLDGSNAHVLFEETDPQWIEPEHGPMFLPHDPGRFLWFSPRDGYRHLYLYNRDGKLLRQVTKGDFDIQDFVGFAPNHEHAFVHASGSNPLQMHLWQVHLEKSAMHQLTTGRGWHSCQVRPDGAAILDTYSHLNLPGTSAVIRLGSGQVSNSVSIGHKFPVRGTQEFFEVQADDKTPLHGTIILPPGMDTSKKHPALLYVYGGPHSQLVKDRWLGGSSVWLHYMATQGYVVCTLDNRGTDNRGIEFSQAVHRRLSELETRDQLKAVEHLHSLPFVDKRRIGVHGWSYGGYMTLNLMLRSPGTFACGASGAPVTDWAQYETGYTERYMDTPAENPSGYRTASVLPLAEKLRGRLLIIHGTDDKTVMWSHSLALVHRLVDADRLVDYMPYPMQKHGIRGKSRSHLYKLLTRYFQDHLGRPR